MQLDLIIAGKRDFITRILGLMTPLERNVISLYFEHEQFQEHEDQDGIGALAAYVDEPVEAIRDLINSTNFRLLQDALRFVKEHQAPSQTEVAAWLGKGMRGQEGLMGPERLKCATTLLALAGETTDRVETVVTGMESQGVAGDAPARAATLVGQLVYQLYLSGGIEAVQGAFRAALKPLPQAIHSEVLPILAEGREL